MAGQVEGRDKFTTYESVYFTLHFDTRKTMKRSFNLGFGGIIESLTDTPQKSVRKLARELKHLFYQRSKDGYYKSKFIFLEHIPDSFKTTSKGIVYFETFCFLEDPCDRDFILDYIKTLLPEIEKVYKSNKQIKCLKYAKKQTKKEP